ncbi:hypothetical protein SAICODRAFT_32173 [Saitoella complicata NRRL Y-17804]|uniref:Chromatin modification-related protein n=1 Tax=Saitoella complicata (strain BCRC 22490 / CBS 7301 / JCM 7358 / NBRC 10748 / NRRL Y-17804) TaxID=698492 RepID=A0A0E9NIU0_SAICN|nr:uncharacterized protein SAICODRAFT_32173 [Saitoella complicata NRRL Y-17804]ODQ50038.1 hypothetical protein SAICODRAFT_32173 [Saitoella complicata NRRL Y-17804]GAO49728.1 hypothetical protein G7K_3871-t1 [Saitoella complicata NRRL Y-17804]
MKATRGQAERAEKATGEIYAALNDFTDAIEALPAEIVRNFTLLREVDAKFATLQTAISQKITHFLSLPLSHPWRVALLGQIRGLLLEALPCADEKVSVASACADAVEKHLLRIEDDYARIEDEIVPVREAGIDPATLQRAKTVEEKRQEREGRLGGVKKQGIVEEGTPSKKRKLAKETSALAAAVSSPRPTIAKPHTSSTTKPVTTKPRPNASHTSSNSQHHSSHARSPSPTTTLTTIPPNAIDPDEPVYCYCQRISFGEMICCDNEGCDKEWFHLECVGLEESPKGKWYCRDCLELAEKSARSKPGANGRRRGRRN